MSATSEPGSEAVPLELLLRVEQICDPFENAWLAGQRPRIEDYLGDATGLERATLLRELLRVELECRHRSGEQPGEEEYQGCFPDDGTLIRAVFRRVASMLARPANPDNAESRAGRADEASPAQSGLPTGPYSPGSSADESTVTEPKPSDEAAEGVLFGDYVLLNQLGRGGMGVVYRARQRRANRIVALKIIRPDLLEDVPPDKRREVLERFQTEAKAAANIEHDHVVTVYEVGEIDGQPFYSMRYVEGRSLGEIQRDGPVPNTRAARYVERVADAVHFIHSRKILHRDLKPKNILVDDQDRPYVTDFGLARWLEGAREVTQRGDWLGSPPYMSPEQARDSTQVTEVSDVYSLGATLYALLTGRPPFQAATVVETLHQVQDEEPVSPRRLNTAVARDLETITLKCLHKEPARRYRTAEALAEDLRCYLEDKPLMHGRPVGQAERVWRWCRRNPWMATAATLVLLTVGTAFGLVTDSRNQALQLADDNADLAGKNAELAISEKEQRNQAEAEKKRAERESANLALQQGSSLYEQGDIGRALLLLARALDLAVRAEDAELERVIRTNLSLWRTRLNGLKALLSHDGEVLTVAFNRDGTKLLTGSTDRTVRVWDAVTGRPAREPLRHDTGTGAGPGYYEHWAQVVATAFSPDGRLVATGTGSSLHRGRSQLWEPGLISPAGTPHRSSGLDQILSRRGSHLLGGLDTRFERAEFGLDEYEMPANLWDLATGQPLHRSRGSLSANQPTWAVAFSPDGRTLLTAGGPLLNEDTAVGGTVRATLDLLGRRSSQKGGRARFWDPATRRPLPHSLTHENAILAVAFSPQGKLVVTGSADRTARVWETDTGRPVGRPYRHEGLVLAVAFSHDGRRILTASANSTAAGFVQLWDVDSGEPLGRPFAHPRPVLAAAFSPDSRIIAAGCGDPFTGQGEAYLWDVATGQPVGPPLPHPAPVEAVAFGPNGRTILTGCGDRTARFWEVATQELVVPAAQYADIVAVSPDGRAMLQDRDDRRMRLCGTETGEPLSPELPYSGRTGVVAFSPDGRTVLVETGTDEARKLQLCEAFTGNPAGPPLEAGNHVLVVAFSRDGRFLVTGTGNPVFDRGPSDPDEARVWNLATGRPLGQPMGHKAAVQAASFSPDARAILTGCEDGSARLWDVATGETLGQPMAHKAAVRAVAFSPDGRSALTGSDDHTARLWDAATGEPVGPVLHHQAAVRAVGFSPDGGTIVTGSDDHTARLWKTATGQPVCAALRHQGQVRVVAFSPDGTTMLTGGHDQTVRLWDAATGRSVGEPLRHPRSIVSAAFGTDGRTVLTRSAEGRPDFWQTHYVRDKRGDPYTIRTSTEAGSSVLRRIGAKWETSDGLGWNSTGRVWRMPAAVQSPPERVRLWVQVLSGMELDEDGTPRWLEAEAWWERYRILEAQGGLSRDTQRMLAWHLEHLLKAAPDEEKVVRPRLGRVYTELGAWDQAMAALSKVIDEESATWETWLHRGRAHAGLRRTDQAITDFTRCLDLNPNALGALYHRGRAFMWRREWEKAVADLAKATDRISGAWPVWHARGCAHAELGQWDKANQAFAAAVGSPQAPATTWAHHALVCIQRNQLEEYRRACAVLLDRLGKTNDPNVVALICRACTFAPNAGVDFNGLMCLAQGDVKSPLQTVRSLNPPADPRQIKEWLRQFDDKPLADVRALGIVFCRAGRIEPALFNLSEADRLSNQSDPSVWLFMALCQHGRGKGDEARTWLGKAVAWIEGARGKGNAQPDAADVSAWDALPWDRRVELQLLRREVEELVAAARYRHGRSLRQQGNLEAAIAAYQEAIRLKPDFASAHGALGDALAAKGNLDASVAALKQAVRLEPESAGVYHNLVNDLAAKGVLAKVIAAYQELTRIQPGEARTHYNLGYLLLVTNALDGAIAAYREAIRLQPDFAEAHCNLGHSLQRQGRFAQALPALRRGHELGSQKPGWRYPSQQWITDCERRSKLDARLAAVLRGEAKPASAAEHIEFAAFLSYKGLYGTAARFYEEAFAAKPEILEDRKSQLRYQAARVAAQAGCGQGLPDRLDDATRARWRKQALVWLEAELKIWTDQLAATAPQDRPKLAKTIQDWLRDPELAALRDQDKVAELPEQERAAYRGLWVQVEELLARNHGPR